MHIWQAIILSIVEGITEFLPISSTGHMILVSKFIGMEETEFLKLFEVVIQLGAILAVVVLYFKRLIGNYRLIGKTILAFIPTAVAGLLFYTFIKKYLMGNYIVVSLALIIGGILLIVFERLEKKEGDGEITTKQALGVGSFQILSMIPGVSRSASTIIGGQILGLSRKVIVEFSFILAIPTMLAASGLDLLKNYKILSIDNVYLLVIGFVVYFIIALLSIRWFISYIQKHSFTSFGVYRIILGIISLILLGYIR